MHFFVGASYRWGGERKSPIRTRIIQIPNSHFGDVSQCRSNGAQVRKSSWFFETDLTVNKNVKVTLFLTYYNLMGFLSMIHQCTIWKKKKTKTLLSLRQSGVKLRLCFQVQMILATWSFEWEPGLIVLDLPPSLKLNKLKWAASVAIIPLTHCDEKSRLLPLFLQPLKRD